MAKHSYASASDRAEKKKSGGFEKLTIKLPEGVKEFKVTKEGIYRLDIIPYTVGKGNPQASPGSIFYERTFFVHRGIGANGDTYICPARTKREKCPICEYRDKLRAKKEITAEEEELIKDLAPKERQLFNVIDLAEPEKGIQIWDISYHLFGKLLDARVRDGDEDDAYDKFFHLGKSMTLKVGFVEKTFGGKTFYEAETIDFKPKREPYDEAILEDSHCLDDLISVEGYQKLKDTFLQTSSDESDEDEDEAPKSKKSKKVAVDDEDDEDDEEDEAPKKKAAKKPSDDDDDEDEDEDDIPAKKPAKSAKKKDDDEDEEDDWNDDEDEAPKAKSKKAAVKDDEDDEDDEEDEAPKKKAAKKPSDDDDDEDEDEDEAPKAKSKKVAADDDDDDEDEEDEDEAPKKKPSKSAKKKDDDEDDWED